LDLFDITRENCAEKRRFALKCLHVQNFEAVIFFLKIIYEKFKDSVVAVMTGIMEYRPIVTFL